MTTWVGTDGRARCSWVTSAPEYARYHDDEWGHESRGDDALFERLSLEGFQSGLSWLVILRKRDAFRQAFDGFSIPAVAQYGSSDTERLLADPGIVRNRAKITATIANARAAADIPGGLSNLLWSYAPSPPRPVPRRAEDVPATCPESVAMAKDLRGRGFRFVGPVTAYALMQATGMVDDHLADCWRAKPGR